MNKQLHWSKTYPWVFFQALPTGSFRQAPTSSCRWKHLEITITWRRQQFTTAHLHACTYMCSMVCCSMYLRPSVCKQSSKIIIQVMIHPIQCILDLDPYKLILELNIESSRVIQRFLKKKSHSNNHEKQHNKKTNLYRIQKQKISKYPH